MSKHSIVHVDFPAHNIEAAGQFYSDLFGWRTQSFPEWNYTTFEAEPGPGGGFVQVGDATSSAGSMSYKPGDVLVYIATDDIDATLAKAESLGGRPLVPKTEIPDMGWFAVFTDPTGNRVGLWTDKGDQAG